jgi:hypothetical protein
MPHETRHDLKKLQVYTLANQIITDLAILEARTLLSSSSKTLPSRRAKVSLLMPAIEMKDLGRVLVLGLVVEMSSLALCLLGKDYRNRLRSRASTETLLLSDFRTT